MDKQDISVDFNNKIIFFNELINDSTYSSSHVVELAVPKGLNIFSLFNLTSRNETGYSYEKEDEWLISINENSSKYLLLNNIFNEIKDIYWHATVPKTMVVVVLCLYLPIAILGAVCNCFILGVSLGSRKKLLQDPRHSFLLSLCFSDLILCIFTSPMTLWQILNGHWSLQGYDTEVLCKIVMAGRDFPIFMSSFCIGAIACDRFRFITSPTKKQMTSVQGYLISCLLAIISGIFVSPVYIKSKLWYFPYLSQVFFCEVDWSQESRIYYSLISSGFHFLCTLLIVGCLYFLLYVKLKKRPMSTSLDVLERRKKTNILLASISLVFFLSWTPLIVYGYLFNFHRRLLPTRSSYASIGYAVALLFGLTSSITNPILYTSLNQNFKSEVKRLCPGLYKIFHKAQEDPKKRRERNEGLSIVENPPHIDESILSPHPEPIKVILETHL